MSATVKYKGQTLGTVSNTTKKLTTKGMYCEDDIEITDSGGGGGANLTHGSKSVTPSETAYSGTEYPPTGYDGFDQFTVNVGAISSDYVGSGVSRQAAQTIHPSTSDQTIAADKYLTGAQTVKGVLLTNLTAENIKKDVVIEIGDSTDSDCVASVTGTYEESGGDPNENLVKFIDGTMETLNCNATQVAVCLRGNTKLKHVFLPLCTSIITDSFYGDTYIIDVVLPSLTTVPSNGRPFYGCTRLEAADLGSPNRIAGGMFQNCTAFNVLVLRKSTVVTLQNTNAFTGTKFASGGAGGTIYIPKSLFDHLGDNSSSDYKKATNWATVNGYGTITWQKIEGSYYETHYADGTLIS